MLDSERTVLLNSAPPAGNAAPPSAGAKSSKPLYTSCGVILGCLALLACCVFACLGGSVWVAATYGPDLEQGSDEAYYAIDTFMTAMAEGDVEAAHDGLSTAARRRITIADLEARLKGPEAVKYENYVYAEIGTVLPAIDRGGRTYRVDAKLIYDDGRETTASAILVVEDSSWLIDSLEITAPRR